MLVFKLVLPFWILCSHTRRVSLSLSRARARALFFLFFFFFFFRFFFLLVLQNRVPLIYLRTVQIND